MPKIRGVKPDYWTDEDIVDLTLPARLLFIGLWNHACDNGHLQDKPKQIKMRVLPGDDVNVAELLRELETANRIIREGGHITIPNFAKHQRPDKRFWQTCDLTECVKPGDSQPETRSAHHVSTSRARGGHDVVSQRPLDDGDGDGELMVSGGEGEQPTTTTLVVAPTRRDDVERICVHLATRIQDNTGRPPNTGKAWRDAARLMLDKDGRPEQEIHQAIDWCQSDDFWRANILSMQKLRAKYDQLKLQAARRPAARKNDHDWDLTMARARAIDNGEML